MALRLLTLAALVAAVAFAGCAGKDAPADDGAAPAPADAAAATSTAAPAPETVVATRAAEETPIHVEGTTSTGACAYVLGQGACRFENGDHSFVELTGGAPMRFAGGLTWTATTPHSQELSVYVLHQREDGYYWFDESSPIATGPSPLAFDFDLGKYNETQVAFGVSDTQGAGAVVGYAAASTSQDFVLDGTFTSLVLRA
jgi:hypothetical protein